jgi:protein-S-isoprenylcysteine O-methyltransferase Ste14
MRVPTALSAAIFIAIVPGSVGGWIQYYIATGGSPALRWTPDRTLGMALIVVGWSILLWCTVEFVRRGRGTPSPNRAPTKLVVSGLFRFVRNPMYVGVVTAIEGFALAMHSWETALYGLVVATAFHLRVLFYEEPRLTREFGDEFETYCANVPRWIPRGPRRNG